MKIFNYYHYNNNFLIIKIKMLKEIKSNILNLKLEMKINKF